jgi:hypothetical protein
METDDLMQEQHKAARRAALAARRADLAARRADLAAQQAEVAAATTANSVALVDQSVKNLTLRYEEGHMHVITSLDKVTESLNAVVLGSALLERFRADTEAEIYSVVNGIKTSNIQRLSGEVGRVKQSVFDENGESRLVPLEKAQAKRERVTWALFLAFLALMGGTLAQWFHTDVAKWWGGGTK